MINWFIRFCYNFTFFIVLWIRFTMWYSRYNKIEVKTYKNAEEISKALGHGKHYRYDKLMGYKSDHVTHPTRFQKRIEEGKKLGDCDDHAIYWCVSLLKSGLVEKTWYAYYSMINPDTKKRSAHAVCVFVDKKNQFYWADYGNPRKINKARNFMIASASKHKSVPVVGALIHINDILDDDTPVFGKRTRLIP